MHYFVFFISLLLLVFASNAQTNTSVTQKESISSIAPIVEQTIKSVVNIVVLGEIPLLPAESIDDEEHSEIKKLSRKFKSYGSGVIVDPKKAYIITNAHIIRYAKKIFVTLHDGSKVIAKKIGSDSATDIAVLKIPPQKISQINLGNSDKLRTGDFVSAIGNPFRLGLTNGTNQTVTFGIISALNRSQVANASGYYDFIQSDAAVNPGSSGGALIDMYGNLIGITTALLVPQGAATGNIGVSFAIPINMAKSIMEQIIKYGSVKRATLGAIVQKFTPELAPAFNVSIQKGAIITQVDRLAPAFSAGLKPGDIITKIDDELITDAAQVRNIVGIKRIGTIISLKLLRHGKEMSFNIKITELEQHDQSQNNYYLAGLQMQSIIEQSPIHGLMEGIQIGKITETAPAYSAGLQPGDIIIKANHISVKTLQQLKEIAKKATNNLLVLVIRRQESFYALLKKEEVIEVK